MQAIITFSAAELAGLMELLSCAGRPHRLRKILIRVTDPRTGNYVEGENITMNLKNTQYVDVEVKPKNRLGGPAAVQGGTWTAQTATSAFTVTPDGTNPLKARVAGNPQSAGGPEDVGIVHFEADADLGDGNTPIVAELAVNVIPADATVLDIEAGTPAEQ